MLPKRLERAFITCNKTACRLTSPRPWLPQACPHIGTTRGFGVAEFQKVGDFIARVLDAVAANNGEAVPEEEAAGVLKLKHCARFPIY